MTTYAAPTDLPIDDFADIPEQKHRRVLPLMAVVAAAALAIGAWTTYIARPLSATSAANPCSAVAADVAAIAALRQNHDYGSALALASVVSHQNPGAFCRGAGLSRLDSSIRLDMYRSQIAAIFAASKQPGDIAGDRQAISKYQAAEAFARRYRIATWLRYSPAQIQDIAYGLGYFSLARFAWIEEYRDGGNHNLPAINHEYSDEVNIGLNLAAHGGSRSRVPSERMLQTARFTGLRWHLARAEATVALSPIAGPDPATWPAPLPDPLLAPR